MGDELREAERYDEAGAVVGILRHYLGKIANRVGRPTRSPLRQVGEIEEVGEGVLAELERLRARDEKAAAVVRAYVELRLTGEARPTLNATLDELARAYDEERP